MERIYYNGDIITMEDNTAEAILVKDGIIKKVGSEEEIMNLKGNDTDVINLNGKCLMPGFIDAHSHITAVARTMLLVDLSMAKDFNDIIKLLKEYIKDNDIKPEKWVMGFNYDHNFLKEKKHPTKEVLDKVSTNHMVSITHASGHMGVVNSLALEFLHIDEKTKDPEGGHFGRIENTNMPNGYMEEVAFRDTIQSKNVHTIEELKEAYKKAEMLYASYGITTAQDGLLDSIGFSLLDTLAMENKLTLDVISYINPEFKNNYQKYLKNYYNHFKIGGYKILLDGSIQGKTAYLLKPYESGNEYCGYPVYSNENLKKYIAFALKNKMQLLAHCNGDGASEQLLSCLAEVIKENNIKNTCRPVMIHAQMINNNQLEKMKKLEMIPSFFPSHIYYFGDIHLKNISDRAYHLNPLKEANDLNLIYTIHTDAPVIKPNILESVWCAVNRLSKNNIVLSDEEKISIYDALKAVTINVAYQYFEENKKGSIKEEKQADFVILDKNPLKIKEKEIKNIKILETIKDGITIYKA